MSSSSCISFLPLFLNLLESTDDTEIVSYHWEEINGPSIEERTSADSPVLRLSNLDPGNYSFRQVGPCLYCAACYLHFYCFFKSMHIEHCTSYFDQKRFGFHGGFGSMPLETLIPSSINMNFIYSLE